MAKLWDFFKTTASQTSKKSAVAENLALASEALKSGELHRAVQLCDEAIAQQPDNAEARYKRGNALLGLGQTERALGDYNQAIRTDPNHANAFCNSGVALERLERWDEALRNYDRASELNPNDFLTQGNRASLLRKRRRFDEALVNYDRAISLRPDSPEMYFYRGIVLHELRRFDEAVESYDKAIEFTPRDMAPFVAYSSRGLAFIAAGKFEAALASFDQAIVSRDDYAEAHHGRGLALYHLARLDEAMKCFERAIALKIDYAEAHVNSGNALLSLNRHPEAVASFDRAILLGVQDARVHRSRGLALRQLQRLNEALDSYQLAIDLDGGYAECFVDRGNVLLELGQCDEALVHFNRAVDLCPSPEALRGRGLAYIQLNQPQAAITALEQALALNPDQNYLLGLCRHLRMQICDWSELETDVERLVAGLAAGKALSTPFPMLSLVDSPAVHQCAAKLWTDAMFPTNDALGPIVRRAASDKIHIAYFSPDFRNHPVSLLTAELFETHDRSRFTITAVALGLESNDPMRKRLERAFDRFINVSGKSDLEVASLARSMGVDVAVDLGGFTEHCRTGIFALRAAPIQVSYIGYLGTMAAPYIDYLLADQVIVPDEERRWYTEKILYLPSYQANDSTRRISDRVFTREELGLRQDAFVFSCFNANYKITPTIFSAWMRILGRVPGSSLFLYAGSRAAEQNIRREAARSGVDPGRVVFGEKLPFEEYLARYRAMDLFLDTLPYNAGTTASDALWAGVPVLTCTGHAFAGRVAASLLTAVDLPELITDTLAQYEDAAVMLATDPEKLAKIRQKLARNRVSAPLFDTVRFTRNLEAAFLRVLMLRDENGQPDDIHADDLGRGAAIER